jgi:hypothetical protein
MAMTKKEWRDLVEVTQPNEAGSDHALIEQLARAVAELNLPPAFLEHVQTAVAQAIRRAWQHDQERAVRLSMAAHVLHVEAGMVAQSWGFFLIEKRLEHTTDRRIEVLLYPEKY